MLLKLLVYRGVPVARGELRRLCVKQGAGLKVLRKKSSSERARDRKSMKQISQPQDVAAFQHISASYLIFKYINIMRQKSNTHCQVYAKVIKTANSRIENDKILDYQLYHISKPGREHKTYFHQPHDQLENNHPVPSLCCHTTSLHYL